MLIIREKRRERIFNRILNIALLGKWCWRLLVYRDRLWRRVLVARYGVADGDLEDGGQSCSSRVGRVGLRIVLGGGWGMELIPIFDVIVSVVVSRGVSALGDFMT